MQIVLEINYKNNSATTEWFPEGLSPEGVVFGKRVGKLKNLPAINFYLSKKKDSTFIATNPNPATTVIVPIPTNKLYIIMFIGILYNLPFSNSCVIASYYYRMTFWSFF